MRFTFEHDTSEEGQSKTPGSSWFMALDETYDMKAMATLLGQMLTTFGEPDYVERDTENLCSYVVKATGEDGAVRWFTVYWGPTGPAIGAPSAILPPPDSTIDASTARDELAQEAAEQLAAFIKAAEPHDYTWDGFYLDGPARVHMGVRNGEAFYEETSVESTEENYEALEKELLEPITLLQ